MHSQMNQGWILSPSRQIFLVFSDYRSFIHRHVEFRPCSRPGSGFEIDGPNRDFHVLSRQV
jgi:hypothetical protein